MRVVTMGEMMIRFMPANNERFEQAVTYNAYYGGDESIVATTICRLGVPVEFVTKLPENIFGDIAKRKLMEQGVETSHIARGGKRLGLNFYENGASIRPSQVIYDRENSAFAEADISDFDFDDIFSNACWFHTSGITPALSDNCTKIVLSAYKKAKEKGITTSIDLNYRRKLWSKEKAQACMKKIMPYIDVLIGNEEDIEIMLGLEAEGTNVESGILNVDGYKVVFKKLMEIYNLKMVATTLRESYSASDNGWSVLVYDGKKFCHSKKYELHLVDRGGGGASFSAGLIFACVNNYGIEKTTEFAAAVSALKQTIVGDFNLITYDEAISLMNGNTTGRVQR